MTVFVRIKYYNDLPPLDLSIRSNGQLRHYPEVGEIMRKNIIRINITNTTNSTHATVGGANGFKLIAGTQQQVALMGSN